MGQPAIDIDRAFVEDSTSILAERAYICVRCRRKSVLWSPSCQECKGYNTVVINEEPPPVDEEGEEPDHDADLEDGELPRATCIGKMKFKRHQRMAFGVEGLDHVLSPPKSWKSKKVAPGAVYPCLIGMTGDPGAGKSTLILQGLCNLSMAGVVTAVIDFEESKEDTKDRTKMCGYTDKDTANLHVVDMVTQGGYLEDALLSTERLGAQVVLVNSLQELRCKDEDNDRVTTKAGILSNPGDPSMMQRASRVCLQYAKRNGVLVILIIQVKADGDMDGIGNKVRHKLDVSLEVRKDPEYEVEGSDGHKVIWLGSEKGKNRYADDTVKARFYRGDRGLDPMGVVT